MANVIEQLVEAGRQMTAAPIGQLGTPQIDITPALLAEVRGEAQLCDRNELKALQQAQRAWERAQASLEQCTRENGRLQFLKQQAEAAEALAAGKEPPPLKSLANIHESLEVQAQALKEAQGKIVKEIEPVLRRALTKFLNHVQAQINAEQSLIQKSALLNPGGLSYKLLVLQAVHRFVNRQLKGNFNSSYSPKRVLRGLVEF